MLLNFFSRIFPNTASGIIATVFSVIAMLIFIFSSTLKGKNKILTIQIIAHVFLIVGEAISHAFASIVQEIISITRNVCVYFGKNSKKINILLIILAVSIGLYCGLFGVNTFTPWKGLDAAKWYGYLPIIANLEYSIVVLNSKINDRYLKLSFGISSLLWSTSFMLQGAGLFISGLLNGINGIVALISFVRMTIYEKKYNASTEKREIEEKMLTEQNGN